MKQECEEILKKLTGKKFVVFVRRGNIAIRFGLRLAKALDYKEALLQDQGGWITYPQFCRKEKIDYDELKTYFGLVEPDALKKFKKRVLLINSMPGYVALQDMKEVERVCKQQDIFLINDATGSIGTPEAKKGDVVFASFGEHKPVNLGNGGFIATDNQEHFEFFKDQNLHHARIDIDYALLLQRLNRLGKRLDLYRRTRSKVLDDLKDYHLIHRERQGINVIARYYSEMEKERLINYCNNEGLEYTLCPRNIRVKAEAVCIEVKRK
jgi:dTDP-4-amino-4,6-dideoxygalactose transaminase